MNTTLYLDITEINKLKETIGENYIVQFRERLKNLSIESSITPRDKIETKKLVGLLLDLDEWKNLNMWIIYQTREDFKPTVRDAMLTLMGI